ncbi:hypothetical protein AAFF_G00226330 [Aldrovandia affinis]|uniref:Uncharacterized protein n=1 Tax=Aldrovandia affinis TaxID=143900 RepID=A0AAD7TBD1_9TELE|nr:hypothetical protein AAFF_G00226330 [Aldrovandia affinis]
MEAGSWCGRGRVKPAAIRLSPRPFLAAARPRLAGLEHAGRNTAAGTQGRSVAPCGPLSRSAPERALSPLYSVPLMRASRQGTCLRQEHTERDPNQRLLCAQTVQQHELNGQLSSTDR